MATTERLVSAEELEQVSSECGRFELLDGRLVKLAAASLRHNDLITEIASALQQFVKPRRLGRVLAGDTGIILRRNPDRVRAPDVCFIAADRLPNRRAPLTFAEIVPDLVVEVISQGDTAAEVQQKLEEWLRAGARLVWAFYPDTHTIAVLRDLDSVRLLRDGDTLDAEPVLPGFSAAVAELFAEL